jgi:RND family efflux transporter MFP subunit
MKSIITIIVSVCTLALSACSKNVKAEQRAIPVTVGTVEMHDGRVSLKYSASLQPYDQVDLAFRAGGYVDHVLQMKGADGRLRSIQDGDHSSRGLVLASLRANDYMARLQEAQAGLADARARMSRADLDYGRASRLFEAQSLTKPDYDAAKASFDSNAANVKAAQERISQAEVTLRDTRLISPMNGIIVKRNITAGTLASPGVPAFTVADISAMKAVFGVPDIVVARMRTGGHLQISTEAFPGEQFDGRITRVSAAADPRSRIFEVEVTVPNPKERLRIGMIASLEIDEHKAEPVAVVPLSAIVTAGVPGKYAVYTVETRKDRQFVSRRQVELGETYGNDVAIASGVKSGDSVVLVGANLLNDGDAIEPVLAGTRPVN